MYESMFENVIKCSDDMVYNFIRWIEKQDFYNDTTIVIVGDHLYMANHDILPQNRYVYATILNPYNNINIEKSRQFTAMDMFPTTLGALGVNIEGNQLGLGVNLFG